MTGFVVDASVVVKWLVDEPLSASAVSLLDRGEPLVAPDLVFAETANALWATMRRGAIGVDDFADALATLRDAPLHVPVPTAGLLASAGRLAGDLDHRVYDCLYLALAMHEQRPVVTADQRFLDAVHRHPYLRGYAVHVADV